MIKAGGQSDKLLEIHTHTEFLIVCILAPEKKTLQAAGLRQCCQLRPYAQAFELKEGKKSHYLKARYLGELSGSLPSNAKKKKNTRFLLVFANLAEAEQKLLPEIRVQKQQW